MDVSKPYFLLLIDLKRSSQIHPADGKAAFNRLLRNLPLLNESLNPRPALGMSLNYGDEISGLFETPASLSHAIEKIRDLLYPQIRIRYVVARGHIGHDSPDITQVGGKAFKRANEAMKQIKKRNRYCHWDTDQDWIDGVLISLSELSNTLIEKMTDYQRDVYLQLKQGHQQKEIRINLGKHQQSVSEAVRRSGAEIVIDAENRLQTILENYLNMAAEQ